MKIERFWHYFLPLEVVLDLVSFLAAALSAALVSLFFGLVSPFLAVIFVMILTVQFSVLQKTFIIR